MAGLRPTAAKDEAMLRFRLLDIDRVAYRFPSPMAIQTNFRRCLFLSALLLSACASTKPACAA